MTLDSTSSILDFPTFDIDNMSNGPVFTEIDKKVLRKLLRDVLKNNFSCESHSVCPCNNTVTKLFSPLFMYRRDLNLLFIKIKRIYCPERVDSFLKGYSKFIQTM